MKDLIILSLFILGICACESLTDTAPSGYSSLTDPEITVRDMDTTSLDSTFVPTCDDAQDIFSRITNNNGILEFDSLAHYENCVKCLEDLMEDHLATFDSTYQSYTDEQQDSIEVAIGFSYFEPLEDFEDDLQFESRRAKIEEEILDWLDQANPTWDEANDPDEQDHLSEEVRTLLSPEGEVRINGTLVDMTDVSSLSVSCFPFSDGCRRWKKSVDFEPYDNDTKRIKGKLVNVSYPWKIKIKGKIVHYKKRSGPGWKRSRAPLIVEVDGLFATSNCQRREPVGDANGPKRRKSLKAEHTTWLTETWSKHVCMAQFGYYEVYDQVVSRILQH